MIGLGGGAAGTSGGLGDGQPCSLATNCTSHVCTGFYVDVDGDGYGAGQAVGFCGTTAPIGYASQSGDCCDSATNLAVAKLIHPGADFQTTSAGGVCGITWDYDCSGAIEQSIPNCRRLRPLSRLHACDGPVSGLRTAVKPVTNNDLQNGTIQGRVPSSEVGSSPIDVQVRSSATL